MSKMIHCKKLKIEAAALTSPPFPGALGERIMNEISAQAFELWKNHQIMLINEYRLNLAESEARKFLIEEMKKFLFEDVAATPPGFKPVDQTAEK